VLLTDAAAETDTVTATAGGATASVSVIFTQPPR
jgi:hypothetical protein